MISKIRSLKNKKGFTLVELIVVLVILAILAALLIPALTGYIDKANKEKVVAETRMVVMAAQTVISEKYGNDQLGATTEDLKSAELLKEIKALSEAKSGWSVTVTVSKETGKVGQVKSVALWDGSYGCAYVDGQYYTKGDTVTGVTVPTAALTASVAWAD